MINKKRLAVMLLVILCVGLAAGLTLGRYAGEWKHLFGLLISPHADTQRRYFRSNELRPVSEGAAYTVNGTEGWLTVANALDSSTVSEGAVSYTLVWYISTDGAAWTEYKTETASFAGGTYAKANYTVSPVTVEGTVYDYVRVRGSTSSLAQEDIEATYTFVYADYEAEATYADGVITVSLRTNDVAGDFTFRWASGVAPDNSDPSGIFAEAVAGPSSLVLSAGKHAAYTFVFFVTDPALLAQLEADPTVAGAAVTVTK